MNTPHFLPMLKDLAGTWTGTNRLWYPPGEPPSESASNATITPVAQGRFVRLDYTWEYEGAPQDGSLLVGFDSSRTAVTAVWVDSWHMGEVALVCEGAPTSGEEISVLGSYAAPPGPDWGWRTTIQTGAGDTFQLRMYNITPDGMAELAVEAVYQRNPEQH